jgi:hypothetical protein
MLKGTKTFNSQPSTSKAGVGNEAKSIRHLMPYNKRLKFPSPAERDPVEGPPGARTRHLVPYKKTPCRPGALGGRTSASHAPHLAPRRLAAENQLFTQFCDPGRRTGMLQAVAPPVAEMLHTK